MSTSQQLNAALSPQRFSKWHAHALYTARSLSPSILAWTPLYTPRMLLPLLYPWLIQSDKGILRLILCKYSPYKIIDSFSSFFGAVNKSQQTFMNFIRCNQFGLFFLFWFISTHVFIYPVNITNQKCSLFNVSWVWGSVDN